MCFRVSHTFESSKDHSWWWDSGVSLPRLSVVRMTMYEHGRMSNDMLLFKGNMKYGSMKAKRSIFKAKGSIPVRQITGYSTAKKNSSQQFKSSF